MESSRQQVEQPITAVPEENVVLHLNRYIESLKTRGSAPDTHAQEMEQLHVEISECACFPMYKAYTEGRVPTLSSLQRVAEKILEETNHVLESDTGAQESVDAEMVARIQKYQKLLTNRLQEIRVWVHSYVKSVARFHTLRRLSSQVGRDDALERLQKADADRRRTHDSLIEALQTYNAAINNLWEEIREGDEPARFTPWQPGNQAPPGSHTLVFSESVLSEDRKLVRDWALAADFSIQLQKIRELAE